MQPSRSRVMHSTMHASWWRLQANTQDWLAKCFCSLHVFLAYMLTSLLLLVHLQADHPGSRPAHNDR